MGREPILSNQLPPGCFPKRDKFSTAPIAAKVSPATNFSCGGGLKIIARVRRIVFALVFTI
jgi:hypothetical protein